MSATNHTTNYELPIFVGSDKPAWLVDWNGAMTAIDTAIHTAEGKADQAGTDIGGIESSISTINSTLSSISTAVSQLRTDTNANTGSINTITSLIGNGEPTTTDKTLIGAINELDSRTKEEHGVFEIWKNSNVTASFGQQNIVITNFDSTKYDAIWIAIEKSVGEQTGVLLYEFDKDVLNISSYVGQIQWMSLAKSSGVVSMFVRTVEFSLSGTTLTITFGDCEKNTLSSYGSATTASTDNSANVPVRVLGLAHND